MTGTKMVVFDLDGILTYVRSSWQMVHEAFGVDNADNFQRYLRGEINYKEFMRSDINLWARPKLDRIKHILDKTPLMKGAVETIQQLKNKGYRTAIISSGISLLADRVKEDLGIDYSYANVLQARSDGRLTGEGKAIVPLLAKSEVLKKLIDAEGLTLDQCIVIGDSKFDRTLFINVGLSIAFNAEDDLVREAADVSIDEKDLRLILPWIFDEGRMAKAEISIIYRKQKKAKAIATAVSPDNLKVPIDLIVTSIVQKKRVTIKIASLKGTETLWATIDDLLACIQVAENTLRVAEDLNSRGNLFNR